MVLEHKDGDDHGKDEDKKSSCEANEQKKEDVAEMVPLEKCTLAAPSMLPTIIEEMEEMFLRLGFSQQAYLMMTSPLLQNDL